MEITSTSFIILVRQQEKLYISQEDNGTDDSSVSRVAPREDTGPALSSFDFGNELG